MNTPQVERELIAILQRRAEDAMNMTDTQTELLELNAEIEGRNRRDRRRWAGGGLAAAAAVVAGFALWSGDPGDQGTSPAGETDHEAAVEVAESFLEAFAAGDEAGAESYVAAGVTPWEGWRNDLLDEGVWRPDYILQPCEEMFTSGAGTRVNCPYEYHALRSEELGLEPFGNNVFTILVADEKVVSADPGQNAFSNGQSDLFEAMSAWMQENHPQAWEFIDRDRHTPAEEKRAFRLWEQYSQEYVDAQTE